MDGSAPAALGVAPEDRLPDGFAVRLDPRTRRRDGGATLLGGSPLRLLRLAPRARELLTGDRLVVRDAATASLAASLLDAGLAHPDLAAGSAGDGGADVTVVVPVKDRPAELARLLAALRAGPGTAALPIVVVDDGSATPVRAEGVVVVRHEEARGPAAARNAGLRAVRTPFVAFLDSDCVPRPGWLTALLPHLADPRLAIVAPRIVGLPGRGWLADHEAVDGALDMGQRAAPVRPLSGVSYVPSAALLCRRSALGAGFDEALRVAEDVDLVWRLAAAGWRVRYDPSAEVAHQHPTGTGEWVRRRAFYGTGAALLAARHGSLVSPLVIAPELAAAVALVAGGGRAGRAAGLATLAVRAARLAGRLARPGERPRVGLAVFLVGRSAGAAARALSRSVTRHHWPLTLIAALVSRRARRGALLLAVADGLLAWLPHRRRTGPVRHLVARRLDDLAYGSGLWAGALRARSARALLPTRPTRPPRPPRG
ncbi:mycofactocin biosynthesis glycosyltransferase MftF [Blastococcus goldschmidtiae]|uniref:Mycofactocin biosynthesis glycosyltransferase MftF n=1 Tax=Blastococcus goldschmidtiae TaxID=3075546 RepID=A0ABU2K2Z9_9ACTN|nr:mycofactocin biosynthesis glycosyltransferase MftF [Blastococcus sp. DSM 46792]MDT0274559.1 mycofactocin biosynthesis glycosyltransferase MftF [Blastococcus sp. DSM 46792]